MIAKPKQINATQGLWAGIIFSLLFTLLMWAIGGRLDSFDIPPDKPIPFWYEWQLRTPTFWTHFTAWSFYAAHQITIWGLIYYAQKNKLRYSDKLHPVNKWALGANAFFIGLHLLQTHLWYDGLAQDVLEQTSQWSVILMLVAVLLMENQRRGMFFGKKLKFLNKPAGVVRTYHGYYFAWAIVYTFWYHPMVSTSGHLIGFFYMFLLMLQGSLFFTRVHVNKWWMGVQEVTVLFHGTIVSFMNDDGGWAMFLFGFAAIFVVTQMYGLGLKRWQQWAFWALFLGGVVAVYSNRGWGLINEVFRIPVAEWLLAILLGLLVWGVMGLTSIIQRRGRPVAT